jgi:hypothetical protein
MFAGGSRWGIARRAVLAPIAALAVFAGSCVIGVVSAPSVALASTGITEFSAAAPVTTSDGVKWSFVVDWNNIESSTGSLGVGLERVVAKDGKGFEFHLWTVAVKTSSLTFNGHSGTLNVGTAASPIAKVDLSFKTTSSKKGACASGSETIYSGTVHGTASLVTGLTGGGTVGGSSLKWTSEIPEITVDNACLPPTTGNPCLKSTIFVTGNDITNPSSVVADGGRLAFLNESFKFIGLLRETKLSAPKGATREDIAGMTTIAAPKYSDKVMTVTTSRRGLVTGSATLSGGKVVRKTLPPKYDCSYKGQKYSVTYVENDSATYASPAGHPISAKTELAGPMTAASPIKKSIYDVVSYKKV